MKIPRKASAREIRERILALDARARSSGPVPVRHTEHRRMGDVLVTEGHLLEAFWFSALATNLPSGVTPGTILLHLRTPLVDGPLSWPIPFTDLFGPREDSLPMVNLEGEGLLGWRDHEGLPAGEPGEPAWVLQLDPPDRSPSHTAALIVVTDAGILFEDHGDDGATLLPSADIEPETEGAWTGDLVQREALGFHLWEMFGLQMDAEDLSAVARHPHLDPVTGVTRLRTIYVLSRSVIVDLPRTRFLPVETFVIRSATGPQDVAVFTALGLLAPAVKPT